MTPDELRRDIDHGRLIRRQDFSNWSFPSGFDLSGAIFEECSFSRASFSSTRVQESVFNKCDFEGLRFSEGNFRLSSFIECRHDHARYDGVQTS